MYRYVIYKLPERNNGNYAIYNEKTRKRYEVSKDVFHKSWKFNKKVEYSL